MDRTKGARTERVQVPGSRIRVQRRAAGNKCDDMVVAGKENHAMLVFLYVRNAGIRGLGGCAHGQHRQQRKWIRSFCSAPVGK